MKRFHWVITLTLIAALLLSGCGSPAAPEPSPADTEPPAAPTAAPAAEPTPSPTPELGDAIVLPDGWTTEQAVSVAEIEALVGDTGYAFFPEASSDAANGNPAGGFVKQDANGNLKLTFLAFVNGTKEKYDFFADYVVDGTLQDIESELWDQAFVGDFNDGSAAVVALKGDLCIRINWFPDAYPQFDKAEFGTRLASLLIRNLYGGARDAGTDGGGAADATSETSPGADSSGLPDELPAELSDAAELNEYAATLYTDYVKPNIFEAPVFSDEEMDAARKALVLIIAAEDKAITLVPDNEHLYYVRGSAYAQCYYDTKNAEDKEKALADLKKAADMGLDMAQTEYDLLAGK